MHGQKWGMETTNAVPDDYQVILGQPLHKLQSGHTNLGTIIFMCQTQYLSGHHLQYNKIEYGKHEALEFIMRWRLSAIIVTLDWNIKKQVIR